MQALSPPRQWRTAVAWASASVLALTLMTGCGGLAIPGIPVTLPIANNVTVPAISDASGTAEVSIGEICDLFSEEDLNALIRQQAGDQIADRVSVSAVELESIEVTASSDSTFSPYTSATLSLDVSGGDSVIMGSASNANGLGTSFSLTRDEPLDLLSALSGECVSPELRLEGGGTVDVDSITFSAQVRVVVFTRVSLF